MVSFRNAVNVVFDTTPYNRLFRPNAGRKYGWHFNVFHIGIHLSYLLVLTYVLERHADYQNRKQREEYSIRFQFERNFTEMEPRELAEYIKANGSQMSAEWTGTKEFLFKNSFQRVNCRIQDLKEMDRQLDHVINDLNHIKASKNRQNQ